MTGNYKIYSAVTMKYIKGTLHMQPISTVY